MIPEKYLSALQAFNAWGFKCKYVKDIHGKHLELTSKITSFTPTQNDLFYEVPIKPKKRIDILKILYDLRDP